MKRIYTLLVLTILVAVASSAATVRILAIGNSFSEDAVEQNFREICQSQGVEVIVGNLYIGGCSIERHYSNAMSGAHEYRYRKIMPNGKVITTNNSSLLHGLTDETWDYISFQQASHDSGLYSTYADLPELIKYVRDIVGQHAKFMWHMTWAYADYSTHPGFANYGNDRESMYAAIVENAKRVLHDNPELKILIPCGTAIENARLLIDDPKQLTRDGYHLNLVTGRYVAAATWYSAIFGRIINANTVYTPKKLPDNVKLSALIAATDAVVNPYQPFESEDEKPLKVTKGPKPQIAMMIGVEDESKRNNL